MSYKEIPFPWILAMKNSLKTLKQVEAVSAPKRIALNIPNIVN